MAGYCKVVLLGNVGRDPELRHTANGKAVVNLSVATSVKKQGEDVAVWHRVTAYDKLAEIVSQYARKGRQILIEGRLNYSTYTDKQGVEKSQTEIIATEVVVVGPREDRPREPDSRSRQSEPEEDLPF